MRIDRGDYGYFMLSRKVENPAQFWNDPFGAGNVERAAGKHEIPLGIDINKEDIIHPVLHTSLYSIRLACLSACPLVGASACQHW
jgi:hypothetical protein